MAQVLWEKTLETQGHASGTKELPCVCLFELKNDFQDEAYSYFRATQPKMLRVRVFQ